MANEHIERRASLNVFPATAITLLAAAFAVLLALMFDAGNPLMEEVPAPVSATVRHHASHMAGPQDGSASSRPKTVVTPVSCEKLPHVPGKSVTTLRVEFPPNAYTGPHRHPGSVTAYVTKGKVRSQMAGEPAAVYPQGGTWFEAPYALHVLAENASATEPAEVLATIVADDDCGRLVIPEP